MRAYAFGLLLATVGLAGAAAQEPASNLGAYLDDALLEMVFPGADSHGPVEGDPPAAAAYSGGELVGYIYEQYDVVEGVGYSKRPFHLVVGLGLDGDYRGGAADDACRADRHPGAHRRRLSPLSHAVSGHRRAPRGERRARHVGSDPRRREIRHARHSPAIPRGSFRWTLYREPRRVRSCSATRSSAPRARWRAAAACR